MKFLSELQKSNLSEKEKQQIEFNFLNEIATKSSRGKICFRDAYELTDSFKWDKTLKGHDYWQSAQMKVFGEI